MKKLIPAVLLSAIIAVSLPFPATALADEASAVSSTEAPATYAHSTTVASTRSGSDFALTVSWNDPVAGQPLTLHCTANGGTGNHKFYMYAPDYTDPSFGREVVTDPAHIAGYTSVVESKDYEFTPMATGSYRFRVSSMDMGSSPQIVTATVTVTIDDPNYPSVSARVNSAVEKCNAETDGSEYQKALWLHDWLLDQLEYDNTLNWSSAEAALCRGTGTCQAYTDAYALLLNAAGITNTDIRDTYDTHTWNAVKIDDQWCQVDCTWDDNTDSKYYGFDSRHLYFGLTDELMAVAHPGHEKIYSAADYGTRSTTLANNYFVRNGEATKWASAYTDRIQTHLDAKETSFSIVSDNASLPPSISGVQNGIVSYALNQKAWTVKGADVKLSTKSVVTTASSTSWTATYSFTADYPAVHERAVADGSYAAQSALGERMCLSPAETGSALSSTPQMLSFAYDESTGLYRISSGSLALEADGRKARLASPDGSLAQLWEVSDAGGGRWAISSAASGLALDA